MNSTNQTVYISDSTNNLGKGMNLPILPKSIVVRQTWFYNLGVATSLVEIKLLSLVVDLKWNRFCQVIRTHE